MSLAPDKVLFAAKSIDIFLFLDKSVCSGYSLEASLRGASNEYPQHIFSWRKRKTIMWISPLFQSDGLLY